MMSQAKKLITIGTPLIVHVPAGVEEAFTGVVEIFGVVEGTAGVVDGAARLAGMDGSRFIRRFFRALVHGAVMVTVVGVGVTSVMGTKEEQNAEALAAISIVLQASILF